MKLSDRQQAILKGILSDRERFAAMTPRFEPGNHSAVTERFRIDDAKAGFVVCSPSKWLGFEMTASLRVMVSRDYSRLEKAGLIQKHALKYHNTLTSHLSLTDAGEIEARKLAAEATSGFCITGAPRDGSDGTIAPAKDPTDA
jgi:hypothetical protein